MFGVSLGFFSVSADSHSFLNEQKVFHSCDPFAIAQYPKRTARPFPSPSSLERGRGRRAHGELGGAGNGIPSISAYLKQTKKKRCPVPQREGPSLDRFHSFFFLKISLICLLLCLFSYVRSVSLLQKCTIEDSHAIDVCSNNPFLYIWGVSISSSFYHRLSPFYRLP